MNALCVGLNEQKVSCSTLPQSVANSCYYYLGRKSKLSFHNEIPPSSLARSRRPSHLIFSKARSSSSSWVVEVAEVEEREGGGWRWWRNGQERRGRRLFPSSFPPSLSAHRAAQQEGPSVRQSHPVESSPISPSVTPLFFALCMHDTGHLPAVAPLARSPAHWGMMPQEFKCAFGSGHPATAAACQ